MKKLMLISSILILVLCSACSSSVVDSIGKDVGGTALIEKVFSSVQSSQDAAGNTSQPISYNEAKGLFQIWLDGHTFPVAIELSVGDQKLHRVAGSDREYYMFQIRGMTRLHDVLVEPNTREMFIYDTGKPEPIEEWYQKFVVPQNKKK